jgi:hypothetical protein
VCLPIGEETRPDDRTQQERVCQATDWNDFFIYWGVDGAYGIVRPPVLVLTAGSLTSRRLFAGNLLTGKIPSYIGQLTALKGLCVVILSDSFLSG